MNEHTHTDTCLHMNMHTRTPPRAQWVKTACRSSPPARCDDGEESVCYPDRLPPVQNLHRWHPRQRLSARKLLFSPSCSMRLILSSLQALSAFVFPLPFLRSLLCVSCWIYRRLKGRSVSHSPLSRLSFQPPCLLLLLSAFSSSAS